MTIDQASSKYSLLLTAKLRPDAAHDLQNYVLDFNRVPASTKFKYHYC